MYGCAYQSRFKIKLISLLSHSPLASSNGVAVHSTDKRQRLSQSHSVSMSLWQSESANASSGLCSCSVGIEAAMDNFGFLALPFPLDLKLLCFLMTSCGTGK